MRIRDPIHGTLQVSDAEKSVIDSRFFQRLRNVRQLGFGELAFPGATHTRHAHSLGAMHVASRLFEAVAARAQLAEAEANRFRAGVRMAVLCHDVGHMPLSHASESIAPLRSTLRLPAWVDAGSDPTRQASHEDFTAKVLLDSSLTEKLEQALAPSGVSPLQVASLVVGKEPPGGSAFVEHGRDWTPLLRSIVSGELDADRMDYLLRDSFYTGVNYGRYDLDWIVQNLSSAERGGKVYLALSKVAAFAFEDFLLSRFHMFLSVYFHHTSVSFDHMLRSYYEESPGEFEVPADPERFLLCDDVQLLHTLRGSKNRWAERIVTRRGFKRVAEFTERDKGYDLAVLHQALTQAGVEHFSVESRGVLSKYFDENERVPLYVTDVSTGRLTDIADYTPLYQRYASAVRLSRLYARPDQAEVAQKVVAGLTPGAPPMSEAMPGVPALEFSPRPPRLAAVVVVYRRAQGGVETFWLKREAKLRFAGGFYAFPGGKVDPADRAIAVEGATDDAAALIVAAARELFEETGLCVPAPGVTGLDAHRHGLLDGTRSFAEVLAATGGRVRAADFPAAGRWITPPFMPGRFDTYFYLVEAPAGQHAEVWPGELTEGEWVRPADALTRWEAGTALLHPPTRYVLETLEAFDDAEAVRARLRSPPHVVDFVAERLEFQRGVLAVPLRTPTLPPATHTNAFVLGTHELLIVDPGTPDDAELEVLVTLVKQLEHEGLRPTALVATHHHADHVGGLVRAQERLGLPVWSHERTADRLPVKTARLLRDGDVLELSGPRPMRWRVLHTPGHARGHVCLLDEASKAAVVGDMVAGVGTIVIDPPEGEMAEYLAQLARLKALGVTTLYPSHGPVIADGPAKLDEYLMHRRWREEKVLEALAALGAPTVEQLVEKAYDDVQAFVWPIAERNTVAILEKLEQERRVRRDGAQWRVR